MKIDLNSDLGEDFGIYKIKLNEELFKIISSANVACGFHAGDPDVISNIVLKLKKADTQIGAHPGFKDLEGFGRRQIYMSKEEIKNMIIYQLGALDAFLKINGLKMQHVKPHGALYNLAQRDKDVAESIVDAVFLFDRDLIILGLPESEVNNSAYKRGIKFANEVFADREYDDSGFLVPRKIKGSVINDPVICKERVFNMIQNKKIKSINGKIIDINPHSICVHGDNENSFKIIKEIKLNFYEKGIEISPLKDICK